MGASAITAASLLCCKILVCMRTELTIAEVAITGGKVKKDCTLEIFFPSIDSTTSKRENYRAIAIWYG